MKSVGKGQQGQANAKEVGRIHGKSKGNGNGKQEAPEPYEVHQLPWATLTLESITDSGSWIPTVEPTPSISREHG